MNKKKTSSLFSINTFLGIIFGIIISLLVFIFITYYINKSAPPYANLTNFEKQASIIDSLASNAFEEQDSTPLWTKSALGAESSEPVASQAIPTEVITETPATSEAIVRIEDFSIPEEVDTKTVPTEGAFYVQAGVFNNANNAEERKAELALLGVSASITSTKLSENNIKYRVRIGPFFSEDQAKEMADRVRNDGIQPYLIRPQ
ncbi:MAG: SPOR domain-containing protein [Neisseriaceae bacterium]|nr:SPOR domain-containing protein [Neisseriaceae bacterium]